LTRIIHDGREYIPVGSRGAIPGAERPEKVFLQKALSKPKFPADFWANLR
jgi:hypothetical protein